MSPGAADGPSRRLRTLAWWLVVVVATAGLVAIYLGPFLRDPGRVPSGLDTPGYVWRAGSVYEAGIDALPAFRDRPGHPVLVSVLRDVTGASPMDLARVWPAVIAASIGLAVVALAGSGLRERPLVAGAVALGVAGSAFVALTAVGYAANLLVDLFVVAAVALAFRVVDGRAGAVAIGMLVVAGSLTHWLFAVLLIVLLLVVAVASLVWPVVDERDDDPRRGARRLLVTTGVAAAVGGLALLLAPGLPTAFVQQTFEGDVDRRIAKRLPPHALPASLAAAAAGAVAIAAFGGPRRRRILPTLVAWSAMAPAGLLAWYGLHLRVPPYRTAAVALAIPALIVLGAAAPASWLLDRGRVVAAAVAAVLVIGATAWLLRVGTQAWERAQPAVDRTALGQVVALDAYLDGLPPGTSVVVPLPKGAFRPPRILRLGMAARHADAVSLVAADLSGGTDAFVRDVLSRDADAAVVFLDVYRRPEVGVGDPFAPGVTLVHGPPPAGSIAPEPIRTEPAELLRVTTIALALLLVSGIGWTLALTRPPIVDAVGLAPAIGAASLVIVGLVAGRLGASYADGGGVAIAAATAAAGWLVWLLGRSRARRGDVAQETG